MAVNQNCPAVGPALGLDGPRDEMGAMFTRANINNGGRDCCYRL